MFSITLVVKKKEDTHLFIVLSDEGFEDMLASLRVVNKRITL